MHPVKQKLIDLYGREPHTLDEIAICVINHINNFRYEDYYGRKKKTYIPEVFGFHWEVCYGEVSNSHSCPLSGITNWSRHSDKVRYYHGWSGRVWIRYRDMRGVGGHFGSTPFQGSMTHTGTGGYGSYSGPWNNVITLTSEIRKATKWKKDIELPVYGYDYRFFEMDWLLESEEDIIIQKLKGDSFFKGKHTFTYTHPDMSNQDQEIRELHRKYCGP